MLTLVLGGAGSGKSEFAERLATAGAGPRIYLATMQPESQSGDVEFEARVAKHRVQRAGRGFDTLEQPVGLQAVSIPAGAVVLLECLTNWAANELFSQAGAGTRAGEAILEGIDHLCRQARAVIVVSGDVFRDGEPYTAGTEQYLELLAWLNRTLAERAEQVVEVVCGMPLWQKGGERLQ